MMYTTIPVDEKRKDKINAYLKQLDLISKDEPKNYIKNVWKPYKPK